MDNGQRMSSDVRNVKCQERGLERRYGKPAWKVDVELRGERGYTVPTDDTSP